MKYVLVKPVKHVDWKKVELYRYENNNINCNNSGTANNNINCKCSSC